MRLLATFLLLVAFCASPATAARYETRADHDPDGIGKFYMGREIAHVMGPAGIAWLERADRDREEQPRRVLDALELREGQTVADFGCGSGYYTFPMAQRVGAQGAVLAVDIEPRMLQFVRARAEREGTANVRTIQASPIDPRLPAGSIDLLLMVDVYHELDHPYEVMQKIRAALKPGGRVALVEYRAEDPKVMIKAVHKMTERQIKSEMEAVGLRHVKTVRSLPLQHLVIFEK